MMTTDCVKIPVLSSVAGASLTAENWQEAKVSMISCHLSDILAKPGYEVLETFNGLASFFGWQGPIVLNAAVLPGRDGLYHFRSPYDGSSQRLSVDDIIQLIIILKPHMVLLPFGAGKKEDCIERLENVSFPFFEISDIPRPSSTQAHGIYSIYTDETALDFLRVLEGCKHYSRYVVGAMDMYLTLELLNQGVSCIESDLPASHASQGRVYTHKGIIDLTEEQYGLQFESIDNICSCSTCAQSFTRAYFYHLFRHTPLLCQRLLTLHNIYFWQSLSLSR